MAGNRGVYWFLMVLSVSLMGCKKHREKKAGEKMQEFVIEIGAYARAANSNFILIPQNGIEVFFNKVNPDKGLNTEFVNAVDGVGVEELFYNGGLEVDTYRLEMLQKIKASRKVLVADYISDDGNYMDAFSRAAAKGFLAFPRRSANYDYQYIPDTVLNENVQNITTLSQAKNYLYLISSGAYSDRQVYLEAIRQTNFDVVIIDAFWGEEWLTAQEVASLKIKANGGARLVIAYMSIGSAEKYRYYWKDDWELHHPRWLKKEYDGYPDEIWVKYWKKEWKNIIFGNSDSYTGHILQQGFDGAYLDNVEAFYSLVYND